MAFRRGATAPLGRWTFGSGRSLRVGVSLFSSSSESFLRGESSVYMERMYESWKKDPRAVHVSWAAYFSSVEGGAAVGEAYIDAPNIAALPSDYLSFLPSSDKGVSENLRHSTEVVHDTSRILQMIRNYQARGYEVAKTDPLGLPRKAPYVSVRRRAAPEGMDYRYFGFTAADLDKEFDCRVPGMTGFMSPERAPRTLRELVTRLEETYCGSIGIEYMHIADQEMCNFIRQAVETPTQYSFSERVKRKILVRTARAQLFENFCASKFSASKRFGLDGCETLIVGMKAVVKKAATGGANSVLIGMPHRGRLNMLMNVMHKPMDQMMSEFQGVTGFGGTEWGNTGDVKYHLGVEFDHLDGESGRRIHMGVLANPSHLEAVDPLLVGQTRAQQYFSGDTKRERVLPIMLHGDASVAGQGVVYETLQLARLPHYDVGGTIHIVCNNQIGFTTYPEDTCSGKYCTDLAKAIDAPILHVNADDPEAVTFVAELALDIRQQFKTDVFIDLVGYRRYGHNELDMPKFTNPYMYSLIARHPPVLQVYSQKLVNGGVLDEADVEVVQKKILDFYNAEYEKSKSFKPSPSEYQPQWGHMKMPNEWARPRETGCDIEWLRGLGLKVSSLPEGFVAHPTIQKTYKSRVDALTVGENIDFGLGEALAFASILADGFHVRLMGQDSERGTFSHRHAVVHDQALEGVSYFPLAKALQTPRKIEIGNSLLSEYAALGFEVGYAMEHPDSLCIWEAQFGDFANGAQIIIDQFITSGETKWTKPNGLVMLLPHGYDGQGPEHSSARIERFLQSCDDREDAIHPESFDVTRHSVIQRHNIQVVNCTTPANVFHVLRRQMHREFRKPLIIFSPKRMLRMRAALSSLDSFAEGTRFLRYITDDSVAGSSKTESKDLDDEASSLLKDKQAAIRRLVLCSGQVYYDLAAHREQNKRTDVAICRVEQLSPFPFDSFLQDLKKYPNLKNIVWAQEEPMNMGPWEYCSKRVRTALKFARNPNGISYPIYVGRDVSSSPAVGDSKLHQQQLEQILTDAFDLERTNSSYYENYLSDNNSSEENKNI